jgi:hypothetical protein
MPVIYIYIYCVGELENHRWKKKVDHGYGVDVDVQPCGAKVDDQYLSIKSFFFFWLGRRNVTEYWVKSGQR